MATGPNVLLSASVTERESLKRENMPEGCLPAAIWSSRTVTPRVCQTIAIYVDGPIGDLHHLPRQPDGSLDQPEALAMGVFEHCDVAAEIGEGGNPKQRISRSQAWRHRFLGHHEAAGERLEERHPPSMVGGYRLERSQNWAGSSTQRSHMRTAT